MAVSKELAGVKINLAVIILILLVLLSIHSITA